MVVTLNNLEVQLLAQYFFQPDETGKQIARGLEQRYYEIKLSEVEGDITKVANKQNPVGVNNPNKDIYFKQADEYQ